MAGHEDMIGTRHRRRRVALAIAGASIFIVVLAYSAATTYKFYNLGHFNAHQHRETLAMVAAQIAAAESLRFVSLDTVTVRAMGPDNTKLAWATAELADADHHELYAWICVEWHPVLGRWSRRHCKLLADPGQKGLFVESVLEVGNITRMSFIAQNSVHRLMRGAREMLHDGG